MVKFGDFKVVLFFDVDCVISGMVCWVDDKNWVYDFECDLLFGICCSFNLCVDVCFVVGNMVSGKMCFQFSIGGLVVSCVEFYSGVQIVEDQVFILFQNGLVIEVMVCDYLYCEVEGINECIFVKVVGDVDCKVLLQQFVKGLDLVLVIIVQCQQCLFNEVYVKLVWDCGIVVVNVFFIVIFKLQVFNFQVCSEFVVSFLCQCENVNVVCLFILLVILLFLVLVLCKLVEQVVMNVIMGKIKFMLEGDKDEVVCELCFKLLFLEKFDFIISLFFGFKDEDGCILVNVGVFLLKLVLVDFLLLVKFLVVFFGIIELNVDFILLVILCCVEVGLLVCGKDGCVMLGQVVDLKVDGDKVVIVWFMCLNKYYEKWGDLKKVDMCSVSLLVKEFGVKKFDLFVQKDVKEGEWFFEVIGIFLKDLGFYVVELEFQKLGVLLLGKLQLMYVCISVLVINLLVYVKLGCVNGVVWVIWLDDVKLVVDVEICVFNCDGIQFWQGKINVSGVVMMLVLEDVCVNCGYSVENVDKISGFFVSVCKIDEKGCQDMVFVLMLWNEGIEFWCFNLLIDMDKLVIICVIIIFDCILFCVGEMVLMKYVICIEIM